MNIKQFAYYTLGSDSSKSKRDESNPHQRKHGHERFHDKAVRDLQEEMKKREAAPDFITATNQWAGCELA